MKNGIIEANKIIQPQAPPALDFMFPPTPHNEGMTPCSIDNTSHNLI